MTTDCQAALIHSTATEWARLRDELRLRGSIQFQWRDVATTRINWPYYAGLNRPTFASAPKPALGQLANAIASRPADPGYTVEAACHPTPPSSPPSTYRGEANDGSTPPPEVSRVPGAPYGSIPPDDTPPTPIFSAPTLSAGRLVITVGCGTEPCIAVLAASVSVPGPTRTFRPMKATRKLIVRRRTTLRLRLSRQAVYAVNKVLQRHGKARSKIVLRVTDLAGNAATRRGTVTLTGRP